MNKELTIKEKIEIANEMMLCLDRMESILKRAKKNENNRNNNIRRTENVRISQR